MLSSRLTLDCVDADASISNQSWEHHMMESSDADGYELMHLAIYWGDVYQHWFSLHMNKGWWFAFLSNVAMFVHLPKTQFLTSAPGDDFLVARCDVGRGITAIALPGTELPKFHDWFRWVSLHWFIWWQAHKDSKVLDILSIFDIGSSAWNSHWMGTRVRGFSLECTNRCTIIWWCYNNVSWQNTFAVDVCAMC